MGPLHLHHSSSLQLTQLPSNTTNAQIDTCMAPAVTMLMPPFTPHTDRFTIHNMYKYLPTHQDSWSPFATISTPGEFAVAELLSHSTSDQQSPRQAASSNKDV